MVFPYSKRVPPKSFVRSRFNEITRISCVEIRKDSAVHVSLSSSSLVKQPGTRRPHSRGREVRENPVSTANDNRFASAVTSLIKERSFTGAKTCLGRGPRQRRAQWAGYRPAHSALSTVLSTNRRIIRQIFATQRSRTICGTCAALEPQSCDVLTYS